MRKALVCAVFGDPIEHSLSPMIHQAFAKQCGLTLRYEKQRVTMASFVKDVTAFFAKGGLGLNITLPLKEQAYQLADQCLPAAEKAKAANTLWMSNDQLMADNTDGIGLVTDIKHYQPLLNQSAHILGAGGAARGIIQPLLDAGVQSLSLSNRTSERALALQSDFPSLTVLPWQEPLLDIDILINTTSANLTSKSVVWPSCLKGSLKLAYDLMYSQHKMTKFMQYYRKMAGHSVDGMGMLIEQAAASFERWHHIRPDTSSIRSQLIRVWDE